MLIKLNQTFLNEKEGVTIEIKDRDGVPIEEFWRKRLKDSSYDNCIEVIEKKKIKKEIVEEKPNTKKKKVDSKSDRSVE